MSCDSDFSTRAERDGVRSGSGMKKCKASSIPKASGVRKGPGIRKEAGVREGTSAPKRKGISRRKADRWIAFGRISIVTHVLLALAKLVMGVAFHSQYFVAGSIYAALTSMARVVPVKAFSRGRVLVERRSGVWTDGVGKKRLDCRCLQDDSARSRFECRRVRIAEERRAYRTSGVIVAIASVSYLLCGVVMLAFFDGTMEADFGTVGGITAAAIAFGELGLAIGGLVSTRGAGEPSLAALKAVNLASSFVSISLAQAALISMAADIPSRIPDALGCIFMACLSLCVGLVMVAKSQGVGA